MRYLLHNSARFGAIYSILLAGAVLCPAQESSNAAPRAPWTQPAFPSTAPQARRITNIEVYPYKELSYSPRFVFDLTGPSLVSAATAEDTVMRRFRAMANEDYAGWLATWDPRSRQEIVAEDQRLGRTPEAWTAQWRRVLARARIALSRRIESGDYVIITYKILRPSSSTSEPSEVHLALKKIGNEWFATNDLRRDGLMTLAPWLSGKDSIEMVAK